MIKGAKYFVILDQEDIDYFEENGIYGYYYRDIIECTYIKKSCFHKFEYKGVIFDVANHQIKGLATNTIKNLEI